MTLHLPCFPPLHRSPNSRLPTWSSFTSEQHEGTTNSSQSNVDKETEQKLEELNKAFESNREDVINKLLDRVVDVKTELHRNLQLKQQQQEQKA